MSDTTSSLHRQCSFGLVRNIPAWRTGRSSTKHSCAWWGSCTNAWANTFWNTISCERATSFNMPTQVSWTLWPRNWPPSLRTPTSACPEAPLPRTLLDISFWFDLVHSLWIVPRQMPGSCLGEKQHAAGEITSTQWYLREEICFKMSESGLPGAKQASLATSFGDGSHQAPASHRFWTNDSSEFIFLCSGSDCLKGGWRQEPFEQTVKWTWAYLMGMTPKTDK